MNQPIVPISDFIRKFGMYANMLADVEEIILTRDSRPFATIRATPQEKNRKLLSLAGAWKGTELDSPAFWKSVRKRKNKKPLTLDV